MAPDMEQLKKDINKVVSEVQALDNVIQGEFRSAAEAHTKIRKRIRLDGDINVIAMAGLMITVLALVYQMATWTTQVNMKLDLMANFMAQTAENTKDIKDLREEELKFYRKMLPHDK